MQIMKFMHSFQSSPSKENHFTRVNYFQRCIIYIEETWCQVSFIFPFPFLSPLEQAHFIQPQFKCTRAEVRSFDGDQGLILIDDVFFLLLWGTPRECKLARTQKDWDRSIAVEHFTIRHEESAEARNKTTQEHYGRKMTMVLGQTTKLSNPKHPMYEQLTRTWKNQHLFLTQNQLVLTTMAPGDHAQSADWGWTPREC